jgi:hypothetical protein
MPGVSRTEHESFLPWAYNSLTFDTTRGEDRVVCEIQPGYGEVRVRWSRKGADLVRLDLRRVAGLAIERAGEREVLVGTSATNAVAVTAGDLSFLGYDR